MALEEKLRDIRIYHEVDNNISKFNDMPLKSKNVNLMVVVLKAIQWDSSTGDHECLYKIDWQSI